VVLQVFQVFSFVMPEHCMSGSDVSMDYNASIFRGLAVTLL